jgi:hypothetical protein
VTTLIHPPPPKSSQQQSRQEQARAGPHLGLLLDNEAQGRQHGDAAVGQLRLAPALDVLRGRREEAVQSLLPLAATRRQLAGRPTLGSWRPRADLRCLANTVGALSTGSCKHGCDQARGQRAGRADTEAHIGGGVLAKVEGVEHVGERLADAGQGARICTVSRRQAAATRQRAAVHLGSCLTTEQPPLNRSQSWAQACMHRVRRAAQAREHGWPTCQNAIGKLAFLGGSTTSQ